MENVLALLPLLLREGEVPPLHPDERIFRDNKILLMQLLVPVAVLAKFIQIVLLPDKYFYDSTRILSMSLGEDWMVAWGGSYETAADLFRSLNFFHFTTLVQWSITLGILFTVLLFVMVNRLPNPDLMQTVFLLASVGVCNIYIFNIGKDIIQFFYFFLVFLLIQMPIRSVWIKVGLAAAVFVWESVYFRSYYIIIAALTVVCFVVLRYLHYRSRRPTMLTAILTMIALMAVALLMIWLSQFVAYEDYQSLLTVRDVNLNEGAVTAIINIFEGESFGIFILNYFINAFRMMVPLELIPKGVFYLPFVIYQLFILYYLIRSYQKIRELSPEHLLALSVFTAYILGSFLFEPDFGSWVRHEAATFPVLHMIACSPVMYSGFRLVRRT